MSRQFLDYDMQHTQMNLGLRQILKYLENQTKKPLPDSRAGVIENVKKMAVNALDGVPKK